MSETLSFVTARGEPPGSKLMPWSAKAQELLKNQYAAVGSASRAALAEAVAALQQGSVAALLERYRQRQEDAGQFTAAYRRYCWPVRSVSDLRLAPFHLLATEGAVHVDRDHVWHMERLAEACAAGDGLLVATPEYNNGMPGVVKNAIDWLSRPAADIRRVFGGKPVAIMGATPGPGGTALSQAAWLPVLRTLGTRPWFEGRVMISGAAAVFDADGQIIDEATRRRVRSFVEGFAAFAGNQAR